MLVSTAASSLRPINGNPTLSLPQNPSPFPSSSSSSSSSSASFLKWRFRDQDGGSVGTSGTKSHAFRILANPNVPGRREAKAEVIMVDPLEAKRIAAKQMQEIIAREKLKRQRQIEAINGAWAMIGLTAGLIIEGQTGQSVPDQLSGYWTAIVQFFLHIAPLDLNIFSRN